ncbi:MAG: response regulator transcription factor [Bacteroidia bacterium]|nr:response regulator transcription factor [Bacteroidia bacterium]
MIKPQPIHILLVEDETSLGFLMKETLRLEDYSVRLCKDGEDGLNSFINERFDLCVFDVNMPKMSGFELAKHVRIKDQHIPIIFLTANNSEADKLLGFEIGADEYITKPFSTPELLARIKAVLKRSTTKPDTDLAAKDEIINIGKTVIDTVNNSIQVNGIPKKISNTETVLLKLMIVNKNALLPRANMLLHVWGRNDFYTARNLDVYINKVRKLLKEDDSISIENIHGSGFKLVEM